MQPTTIFCPQCNTLILDQPACPQCGWKREPAPVETTGVVAWRQEANAKVCTNLTLAGDLLLFGTEDGTLHAWDTASGDERWTFSLPEGWVPSQTLAVGNDQVFVTADDLRALGSHNKALITLNLADGRELWRYETAALRLSPPLHHRERVYFAASDRTFHAVDARSRRRRWQVTLPGWGRFAPAAGADHIYFGTQAGPSGPGVLIALRAEDGVPAWPPVPCAGTVLRPTVAGDDLYVAAWEGTLYCLDMRTGQRRWERSMGKRAHILTPPVVHGRLLFFGARDRHLYALDRTTGETVWRVPTEGKVHGTPIIHQGVLYAATSGRPERLGRVYALDPESGELLWPQPLELEDRVEHGLAGDGTHLYVATRHGQVWGVVLHQRIPAAAPQVYEEAGDREGAAVAYALQGDYARAGQLYAQLGAPYKAAQLYYKAGQVAPEAGARHAVWQRAAELYEEAGAWQEARAVYRDLNQPIRVAHTYAREERWTEAATWFERAGSPAQAGQMYERAEQWEKAAQMYEQAGDIEGVRRCRERLGDRDELARWLVAQGMLDQAAAEYEKLGDLARAAELYTEADRLAEAAALYKRIQAWDQARALYRRLGNAVEEAACCEKLMEWEEAAQLYESAAQALEAEAPPDEVRVAELYDRAALCYERAFRRREQAACWRKVIRYRRLPEVELTVEQQEPFVVGEKNVLLVTVKNVGFGAAYEIQLRVRGDDFEGELSRTVPGLPPGESEPLDFSVKPRVAGRALFEIRMSYRDAWGTPYTREERAYVRVEREPSAAPFTPQVIEIQGDWVVGQKGDRVEIQRGERRIRIEAGDERGTTTDRAPSRAQRAPVVSRQPSAVVCGRCGARLDLKQPRCPECHTRYCPHCHNPLEEVQDLRYCYHCRAQLDN